MTWPLRVVTAAGPRLGVGQVLGRGGDQVERLLAGIAAPRAQPVRSGLVRLAQDTPAGLVDLPVAIVALNAAAGIAARVDPAWVASVEERRAAPRRALLEGGRGDQLEAALHLAMLVATERLPPFEEGDDIRAASGSQLWLLGGAVAAALAQDSVFDSWAELMGCGLWPLGPAGDRLIVGEPAAR